MSELTAVNSVYNIEIEKIDPNPDQPRKHFSDESLRDLAESIRRYGVMQPITVFRREIQTESNLSTRYEIIAGERRWRASVRAGMSTIPAIIHEGMDTEQERFELSILENLQREDLNPVDKARSFARLSDEFGMKHAEIADQLGKSREYVTNSLRLLALPDNVLDALSEGHISEGHTRPLLSLKDRPDELQVLFAEITTKKLTVRDAEKTARSLSGKTHKAARYNAAQPALDAEMESLQSQLTESLGTPVSIDKKEKGGKLTIEFFSRDDLKKLLSMVGEGGIAGAIANNGEQFETPVNDAPIADVAHSALEPTVHPQVDLGANVERPAAENESEVQVTQAIENSISDFVGVSTKISQEQANALPDDFEITPRGHDIQLDPVFDGKTVITQSAHTTESVRSGSATDPTVQGASAHAIQQEIDQLAALSSSQDLGMQDLGPKQVDLGTIETHAPEFNIEKSTADSIQAFNPYAEEKPTPDPHTHPVEGLRDATATTISDVGSDFVPESVPLSRDVDVTAMGGDFVPHNDVLPETPTPGVQAVGEVVLSDDFAPDHNTDSTVSNEKYPGGDPYRLDNFSV